MFLWTGIILLVSWFGLVHGEILSPIDCATVRCIQPSCTDAVVPPGKCCPVCPTELVCLYKGTIYQNGQRFKDDCNTCSCNYGLVSCTKIGCVTDSGRCYYKEKFYDNGETFKDDCNKCRCWNGIVSCTKKFCGPCLKFLCPQLRCPRMSTPAGKCCPVCLPIIHKPDCSNIFCPAVYCEGQYTKPGDCCPTCPDNTM